MKSTGSECKTPDPSPTLSQSRLLVTRYYGHDGCVELHLSTCEHRPPLLHCEDLSFTDNVREAVFFVRRQSGRVRCCPTCLPGGKVSMLN